MKPRNNKNLNGSPPALREPMYARADAFGVFSAVFKPRRAAAFILACVFVLVSAFFAPAAENIPYITYNYDYREYIVYTPAAYVPLKSVSGTAVGAGAFSRPLGMCADTEGRIYIADTGNNRIVILNREMTRTVEIIDTFSNNGEADTFSKPSGLYISPKNELYIADTGNCRVVALTNDGLGERSAVRVLENPESDVLGEYFRFEPLKVAVDYADRVYCVAQGMFQGLMVFDADNTFSGFFGTIEVTITAWQRFWRFFSTQAERRNQALFIPTEFTGIDIDEEGFVYASHISPDDSGKQAVRRLNPKGEDVIRKGFNNHVGGDIQLGTPMNNFGGPSNFVDITLRGSGMYSLLDSKRGRVFTYDHEGNILYIFGGLGSQAGTFRIPAAIEYAEPYILVLDEIRAEIQVFEETNYGRLINEAVELRFDGDEKLAVDKWREVLRYDENFELANIGIGKAYLTAGENKLAMHYLRLGMNREYYSIAFKRYRNEILKENLSSVLTGAAFLIIAGLLYSAVKRSKGAQADDTGGAFGE